MALFVGLIFLFGFLRQKEISFFNTPKETELPRQQLSSLRGENCENYKARPIAVMLASDPAARPLSGISQADMVFEMPVTPNGITRLMAVFQCRQLSEIGSVRSAREDFLPLAGSLGAIYAHWGGEAGVLDKLDNKILDNLDGLKNVYNEYYRKSGIKAPHNGFTNYENLKSAAFKKQYSLENSFAGYPRREGEESKNIFQITTEINISYSSPFNVKWAYDSSKNSYNRYRNNSAETDKNSGEQVEVKNVIVMKTSSSFVSDQYIKTNVLGGGEAAIYKNGILKTGRWEKKSFSDRIIFYDNQNNEIPFEPGPIWFHYVTK